MIINVLNLSRKINLNELTLLFKTYGTVESCDIVMDKKTGESKGFGFVKMPNDDEANAAIKALHGNKIGGSKIRVKAASNSK